MLSGVRERRIMFVMLRCVASRDASRRRVAREGGLLPRRLQANREGLSGDPRGQKKTASRVGLIP